MQDVALDFESYYDSEYSLRKKDMSTSEYVRDERFEAICVGIRIGRKKAKVYYGPDIKTALDAIDWSQTRLVAHHTRFDGLILSHHYGHVPAVYACTLSMARGIYGAAAGNDLDTVAERRGVGRKVQGVLDDMAGKHLADLTDADKKRMSLYCGTDTDLTYQLLRDMLVEFPPHELGNIDITVLMFADPVLYLDRPRAAAELKREQALEHVVGYSLFNEGSIRDYQLRTRQWMIGKNFDASGSFGPELVTAARERYQAHHEPFQVC